MKWLPGLPALLFATTSPLAALAAPATSEAAPSPVASASANETVPDSTEPAPGTDDSATPPDPAAAPPAELDTPPSAEPSAEPPVGQPLPTEPSTTDLPAAPEATVAAPASESKADDIDTLAGHLRLGAAIYGTISGGDPSPPLNYGSTNSIGPALDLGFGVSRNVALGLYGAFGWFSPGSNCEGCSARAITGGAFVRYHLVQGLRLDPWISYGVGVRSLQITDDNQVSDVVALEWLRARVGTDWFLAKNVAFGPFLDLGLSSTLSAPRGDAGQVMWEVGLGFRLALDVGL